MAVDLKKLRGMSPDELTKQEEGLREEIWKLRMQVAIGQLQDPHRVRLARRDLARVLTVRRASELSATNR
jgi:large subunit ribosomal protein L29